MYHGVNNICRVFCNTFRWKIRPQCPLKGTCSQWACCDCAATQSRHVFSRTSREPQALDCIVSFQLIGEGRGWGQEGSSEPDWRFKRKKKQTKNRNTWDSAGREFFPAPLRTSCWHTEHTYEHIMFMPKKPPLKNDCIIPLFIVFVRSMLHRVRRDLPGSVSKGGRVRRWFDKCSAS